MGKLRFLTVTPAGFPTIEIAVAGCRAGAIGVVDLEFAPVGFDCSSILLKVAEYTSQPFGIKLGSNILNRAESLLAAAPASLSLIIVTSPVDCELLQHFIELSHMRDIEILLQITCTEEADIGAKIGVDGIIAKGNEAGGRVSDLTTFILLQQISDRVTLPIWVHGGIGIHTAAAGLIGGAVGAVLDSQLLCTRESPLSKDAKRRISRMDGLESICLADGEGAFVRFNANLGSRKAREVVAQSKTDGSQFVIGPILQECAGWQDDGNLFLFGQDIAFAGPLAQKYVTVGGVIEAIHTEIDRCFSTDGPISALKENTPLAVSHGTKYPLTQGPMARISDTPDFLKSVAEEGALPFLAVGMMRGVELEQSLAATEQHLQGKSWGVGILGFIADELLQDQLTTIYRYHPRYAIIAGGRPDQAEALEKEGIGAYLHVPSPTLLTMFLEAGAKKFVFEGREAGGHVAPLCSFVLWESMVQVLLQRLQGSATPEDYHVLFAGGIHNALSSAMIAAVAAALVRVGVKVGIQLGTAYLFTEEIVEAKAICPTYSQQALHCRKTILLETAPGHASRCAITPFVNSFAQTKAESIASGLNSQELFQSLEKLNIGRLRIAAKGVQRSAGSERKLEELSPDEQLRQGLFMVGQLAALKSATCTIADLHQDIVINGERKFQAVCASYRKKRRRKARAKAADIAIIGMSCLLPMAPDIGTYWENILNGVNTIKEVPVTRWDWRHYFSDDQTLQDKYYAKWGAFLDAVPFDPLRFGMPPNSLSSIEPLQLLSLKVADQVIKDAGYSSRQFAKSRTSVIMGLSGSGDLAQLYGFRSTLPMMFGDGADQVIEKLYSRLPLWSEDSFAGLLLNVTAGRIANRFDLGGTNFVVDAACGSSLAAIYLAVKELVSRTSDVVIVGAADCMQNPFTYFCFSKTLALSPRGICRTFDKEADGTVIGEGLGALMLKRLADAERDGDRIYAVIKGVGAASDGKAKGLTAPRREGQVEAFTRAYEAAGVAPDSVGLIEAHGTGTPVGDTVELEALTEFFQKSGARKHGCALGSVKSMIGHTKSMAGLAGVLKATLSLYHRVLPPTLGVDSPNPILLSEDSPFYVSGNIRPWIPENSEKTRRAGVSALGFGGTNFHVVLEEYRTNLCLHEAAASYQSLSTELFIFRAAALPDLLAAISLYGETIEQVQGTTSLADLAYSQWQAYKDGKQPEKDQFRLAIIATDIEDLKKKLKSAEGGIREGKKEIKDPRGVYFQAEQLGASGKVAFLFPGQGSQYPHMLSDLAVQFPAVHELFERSMALLREKLPESLGTVIFPKPFYDDAGKKDAVTALSRTQFAQPAIGTANLALYQLLASLGVKPQMAAGHSYGEYVALCASGVLQVDDLVMLSEARGRMIAEAASPEPGTMASVNADIRQVESGLRDIENVWIANINAPAQTVISGHSQSVEAAVRRFSDGGIRTRILPVSCAFHSPVVVKAASRLEKFLSSVRISQPVFPVYSNRTTRPYPIERESIISLLGDHLQNRVQFVGQIEEMYKDGARLFVEVGPNRILTNLVAEILADKKHLAIPTNMPGQSGFQTLQHCLGQLAVHGLEVQLEQLFHGRGVRPLEWDPMGKVKVQQEKTPNMWLVDGGGVHPAAGAMAKRPVPPIPKADPGSAANLVAELSSGIAGQNDGREECSAQRIGVEVTADFPRNNISPFSPDAFPRITGEEDTTEVVLKFQQLMGRFLEVQKNVMLAYLGQAKDSAETEHHEYSPSVVTQGAEQDYARVSLPEVDKPLEQRPTPALVEPGCCSQDTLLARLFAIVAERTGYPPEMLEAGQDLEADLGIDSIKRVEILGSFLKCASQELGLAEGTDIANFRGLRTFGEISAAMFASTGITQRVTAGNLMTSSAPGAVHLDHDRLLSSLFAIVAERTGYPQDMLEAGQDLEADLGIDSIKRVEILGSFVKHISTDLGFGEPIEVKGFGGLRTFGEIIACIVSKAKCCRGAEPAETEFHNKTGKVSGKVDKEQLLSRLFAIVAERTGYPPEMLEADQDLEADLGIDSIKRVEILGSFLKELTEAKTGTTPFQVKSLSGHRTFRDIVAALLSGQAEAVSNDGQGATSGLPSSASLSVYNGFAVLPRFTLRSMSLENSSKKISYSTGGVYIITDDEGGIAEAVSRDMQGKGYTTVILRFGKNPRKHDPEVYSFTGCTLEEMASAVRDIRARYGTVAGVVHLIPLRKRKPFSGYDFKAWQDSLNLEVKTVFLLTKLLSEDLKKNADTGGSLLIAATALGGAFGLDDQPDSSFFPGHGGVVGFLKTIAVEWPEVHVKAIDLDPREPLPALIDHLREEIYLPADVVEIGYRGNGRLGIGLVNSAIAERNERKIQLSPASRIVVTGGARGITAEICKELAGKYQPQFIFIGRTQLPPDRETEITRGLTSAADIKSALIAERKKHGDKVILTDVEKEYTELQKSREIRCNIELIRSAGSSVHYFQMNVRDEQQFEDVFSKIRGEVGTIDGVIHGAGIIEDKLIESVTEDSFDRVFGTKAESVFLLSRLVDSRELRFLVLFSSVAGCFGNSGQSSYTAANEVVNKYARYLSRNSSIGRVISINWGPWKTSGMVSELLEKQFASRGVRLIPPESGAWMFDMELAYGEMREVEVVIGDGPWGEIAAVASEE